MRRRLTVTVAPDGATFVLRGWGGGQVARDAGLRPIFSGSAGGSGGWILDATRLPDLLAAAQSRNIAVLVEELATTVADRPVGQLFTAVNNPPGLELANTLADPATEEELSNALDSSDAQLDLFGGEDR